MTTEDSWTTMMRGQLGPSWRWILAHESRGAGQGQMRPEDSDLIAATKYHRQRARCQDPAAVAVRFPDVAAAERLEADKALAEKAKILALANCPLTECAPLLGIPPATLCSWESLFFDVRPALRATDWIVAKVMQKEQVAGNGSFAAQLKLAYGGGPVAGRALIHDCKRLPMASAAQWLDRKLRLHVKWDLAVAMTQETTADHFQYAKFYTTCMLEDKRIELARAKVEERCLAAWSNLELARERLRAKTLRDRPCPNPEPKIAARHRQVPSDRVPLPPPVLGAEDSPLAQLQWAPPQAGAGARRQGGSRRSSHTSKPRLSIAS